MADKGRRTPTQGPAELHHEVLSLKQERGREGSKGKVTTLLHYLSKDLKNGMTGRVISELKSSRRSWKLSTRGPYSCCLQGRGQYDWSKEERDIQSEGQRGRKSP